MDLLHTKYYGETYFEVQNINILLGCINEDPVKLTLSLPVSPCPINAVKKEIIIYEV
jgi:hypothetical protein